MANYDYIRGNIKQRDTIVLGFLNEDYYYLKFDNQLKLFRNREPTAIFDIASTFASENSNIYIL